MLSEEETNSRFKYGLASEEAIIKYFNNNEVKMEYHKPNLPPVQRILDFQFSDNVFLELKTRRCAITKYPEIFLGTNKIKYYNDNYAKNRANKLYIIFGFIGDDNTIEYYYIKYMRKLFHSFIERQIDYHTLLLIPTSLLKPIDKLVRILKCQPLV